MLLQPRSSTHSELSPLAGVSGATRGRPPVGVACGGASWPGALAALDQRGFEVFYQPVVDLLSGRVVLVEALVRCRHPVRGLLEAEAALRFAAQCGDLETVESWVLNRACASFAPGSGTASWAGEMRVAVNIQPARLNTPKIVEEVAAVAEQTGFDAARLVLELTEHTMLQDPAVVRPQIDALRALGVRFALDDFGAGYSMHHLFLLRDRERSPFDILKIDRSFVQRSLEDPRSRSFIGAILSFGRSAGLEVIAEGIEERKQEDLLRSLGCRLGQGFRIQRPVPLVELMSGPTSAAGGEPALARVGARGATPHSPIRATRFISRKA